MNKLLEVLYANADAIPKTIGGGHNVHMASSWTKQFILTSQQRPTQGQHSQAHMHNMVQATQ